VSGATDGETAVVYAFEAALHARPAEAVPACSHVDAWGTWPVLAVPREALAVPLAIGFDAAFERLAKLERMYAEPDGSFVWTSPREGLSWQVDGNAFERSGRVLLVDLKGTCPADRFDALLAVFGWPEQPLMIQLVRPAVFVDEETFRRHAARRWKDGPGKTLRPG
jgi:hypothetical protein